MANQELWDETLNSKQSEDMLKDIENEIMNQVDTEEIFQTMENKD